MDLPSHECIHLCTIYTLYRPKIMYERLYFRNRQAANIDPFIQVWYLYEIIYSVVFYLHWLYPICIPQILNIVPNVQHFLSNLCFATCPLCATLRKNFNSKMTKMNGNRLNIVFKMIKLTSKAVFTTYIKIFYRFSP